MADGASSAPAPAPAPVAARGRPTAAPGPIELADEKTVQTLATPDSFGAPLARLSPYHDLCPPPAKNSMGARTPRSAQVYGINTGRTLRSLIPPLSSDLTIVNRPPVASAALGSP